MSAVLGGPAVRSRVVKASAVVGVARDVEAERAAAAAARAEALALEAARQDAVAAAYAAGLDEGRRQAEADGVAAAPRGAAALEELVRQAQRLSGEEVAATSRAVLSAALDIAAWVLRAEVSDGGRSLVARLEEAAGALLPCPTTRVLVSPADAPAVHEWATRTPSVEVVVVQTLQPGEASVETDSGSVEVSVAAALRVAAEALGLPER